MGFEQKYGWFHLPQFYGHLRFSKTLGDTGVPQTRAIPELETGVEPVGEMHRNRRGHGLESGFNL